MSIVEGFAGMRVRDGKLSFAPQLPKEWKGYSFKINFRNQILKVEVTENKTNFTLDGNGSMTVLLNEKEVEVNSAVKI